MLMVFFFFNDTATTEIYTLSLHDALPILRWVREVRSSDIAAITGVPGAVLRVGGIPALDADYDSVVKARLPSVVLGVVDRKSTRLNSSHGYISYAVFCLKKKQ